MNDTSPEIEARIKTLIQQKSGSEKFLIGCSMYEFARALVLSSLKAKHPDFSPKQLKYEMFLRFYMEEYEDEQLEKVRDYFALGAH